METIALEPHGGAHDDGTARRIAIDASASVNPFGPAPSVQRAVRAANLRAYPEPTSRGVRMAAGGAWGVALDEIACGNGCGELIAAAASAILGPEIVRAHV